MLGFTSARKHAERWVNSTCGYCSVGCGMQLGVRDRKVVSVRGNPDHPVNRGKLCPKGLAEHYAIDAEGRALYPMLKSTASLSALRWDEAIRTMVDRFRAVQQIYGPESVGVISTGQLVTEEFYTLGKLVQLGLGTRNYDGNTTLCMSTAVAGYKRSFGSDGPPGAYEDLEVADVVLLIGANIAENHPILCSRLETNKNRTLIVVDPRVTKTAMMADVFLPIKPRGDLALLNAMLRILIDEGLYDSNYVEQHTTGFDDLRVSLEPYTLEYASEMTGLDASADSPRCASVCDGEGSLHRLDDGREPQHQRHRDGQCHQQSCADHGQHWPRGSISIFDHRPMQRHGNARGRLRIGACPAIAASTRAEHRNELARIWNIDVDRIPTRRGLAYPDIIEAAVAGKIHALWIIGTNPLVSFPNIDVLKQALENLDFLVVQDGFHPTPTTELADLVLPAAIWGEKEGTYTNSERRVSKVNAAVDPPGEARSDFEIFLALAEQLGCRARIVSRLEPAVGCIRRVAPRIGGTALRLLRNDVRDH